MWKIHSLSYFPSRLPQTFLSIYPFPLYLSPLCTIECWGRWRDWKAYFNHIGEKTLKILVLLSSYATLYTNCLLPLFWFVCVLIQLHLLCSSHARDSLPFDSWSFTLWARRPNSLADSGMSKVKIRRWNQFYQEFLFTLRFTFPLVFFVFLSKIKSNHT